MPSDKPAEDKPARNGRQLKLTFKLLGLEMLWHSTPAPPGITLRDLFAAHIVAGMMLEVHTNSGRKAMGDVARTAYLMADAMLAARGPDAAPPPQKPGPPTGDSDTRPGIG